MPGPLTPASGSAPYCTPAEFFAYIDVRLLGDLVRDDGARLNVAGLSIDAIVATHLTAASGELESACVKGGRYAPADLKNLAGNGHALLARLVAQLAFGSILARRGYPAETPAPVKDARDLLALLGAGEAVLPFVETEAAGNPVSRFRTAQEILRAGLASNSYQGFRFMGPPSGGAYTRFNGFPPGTGGSGYGGGW